jgi:hypothetical protein
MSRSNFGFDKDTAMLVILVTFVVQKFARPARGNDGANV